MLTNSLTFFEYIKLQTWLPVSTQCIGLQVRVFQNLIHLSAVPPPLHMVPCWCGDHAMALTAATWSVNLTRGLVGLVLFQIISLLSLPPDASCCSSGLHLRPHTSYLCPSSLAKKSSLALISLCNIDLSREPLLMKDVFHAIQPILPSWPAYFLTIFYFYTSQVYKIPLVVPTAKWSPPLLQLTLVTCSY